MYPDPDQDLPNKVENLMNHAATLARNKAAVEIVTLHETRARADLVELEDKIAREEKTLPSLNQDKKTQWEATHSKREQYMTRMKNSITDPTPDDLEMILRGSQLILDELSRDPAYKALEDVIKDQKSRIDKLKEKRLAIENYLSNRCFQEPLRVG